MKNIKQFFKHNIELFNYFLNQLEKHHVKEYSIQCAYYTILAFIPFIILIFSLIQHIHISQNSLFFLAETMFPSNIYDFVGDVMKEASFKSISTLSVSAIILVWSASKGSFALCKGLHYIYNTSKEYNYWLIKLKSIIWILIFIVFTVVVLFLIVFGYKILNYIQATYNYLGIVINIIINWRFIWQFFILFFIFLCLYKFIPNHKVEFKTQIPGAIFSAFSWYFLSYIFSAYLKIFTGFSIIYGHLTSLILLMIWVYWCMFTILVGAEINTILCQLNKFQKNKKTALLL